MNWQQFDLHLHLHLDATFTCTVISTLICTLASVPASSTFMSAPPQSRPEPHLKLDHDLHLCLDLNLKLFGWMNANPPGGFNAPHTHPGAHWSGVYYVSLPEIETGNSGMIEFMDPRTDLPNWRLLKSNAFSAKKKIRPAPGEMILFPSYLVHWVYPNEATEERVSIAFNATFSKPKA